MDAVDVHHEHAFMFIAEGVFMYFEEPRIRSLVLTLRERFPGAELVFDACSPFVIRANTSVQALSNDDRSSLRLGAETREGSRGLG